MNNFVFASGNNLHNRYSRLVPLLLRASLALLCVLMLTAAVDACPTCKDGMAQDPERANVVRGYFWSILFMMSAPFLIFGGIGMYFYREIRRYQREREVAAPHPGAGRQVANSAT